MNKKGFTLIELLAVIVILGIVVGVAIPGINAVINNSRQKSVDSEAKLIEQAIINKMASDSEFDIGVLNKNNLLQHIETDGSKYESFSVVRANGKIYVTIKKDGFTGNSSDEEPIIPIIVSLRFQSVFHEVAIENPTNMPISTFPDTSHTYGGEWVVYYEKSNGDYNWEEMLMVIPSLQQTVDFSHLDLSRKLFIYWAPYPD